MRNWGLVAAAAALAVSAVPAAAEWGFKADPAGFALATASDGVGFIDVHCTRADFDAARQAGQLGEENVPRPTAPGELWITIDGRLIPGAMESAESGQPFEIVFNIDGARLPIEGAEFSGLSGTFQTKVRARDLVMSLVRAGRTLSLSSGGPIESRISLRRSDRSLTAIGDFCAGR